MCVSFAIISYHTHVSWNYHCPHTLQENCALETLWQPCAFLFILNTHTHIHPYILICTFMSYRCSRFIHSCCTKRTFIQESQAVFALSSGSHCSFIKYSKIVSVCMCLCLCVIVYICAYTIYRMYG